MGAGGGAAWATPEVTPSVDKATPPAASAPVHRRSHGLVCVLIFMLLQFPIGMRPKPVPLFRLAQIRLLTVAYLRLTLRSAYPQLATRRRHVQNALIGAAAEPSR